MPQRIYVHATPPEKLKSPAWHKKILVERLASIKSGKARFLTVAQLKKRLAKRAS